MNEPEPRPTDDPLADLLGATAKDAPEVDRAFLDRLRARSCAAFEAAGPAAPATHHQPKPKTMFSLRWIATVAAAVLVAGLVTAYWIATQQPAPEPPPREQKFVFEDKLTDDGRIGKVADAQGVVAVKPVQAERWSPVQAGLVLKPGDWVRTDARGANAAAVKLLKSAQLVVGPHSLVELVTADRVHLLNGELEVSATEAAPVELTGPDKQTVTVKSRQLFRIEKEKLVRTEHEPRWLQGFRGTATTESVGSLIAKVDGRNVPLTVGYHHVTVDIRDQIARTTIEESFVNTTGDVLEGVFHFPLPQDASISGFGMWIGDKLVEADVVEKQRAREIYEEILREKRDPGLLEWAGGNIFKARVYPIPGRSEKRIKITYTQVLPLQGNRYRYSYALQSELLKQHPLRELKIDVTVNSAAALKGVSSPTHPARVRTTEHSGRVEFAAQEYTPTRDFEAVVEVEPERPDVVVVPHRRGDDGYFMVQLTPPGAAADWERPLVPGGPPIRLLVVADTSASMDKSQRANQAALLNALLGALTPKDTFNVAACDVGCEWVFEKPVPAAPANVAAVQQFLEKRSALGWTDLDQAFASALKMAEPGTHVVYLGDAVPTTGNADPVAFAQRLRRLYEGKTGTFHAVALGSSYEPAALKAIGSLGGGSVRRVSADRPPQATALDLLTEIAAPSLRDLKVEFRGLQTARVYPEVLPNVPAGTQQILLGRYLPEGKDQSGEIVVTGTLGGKPVRYTSKVALTDAEQGNSFVPRLWARMHLDTLLEQGRTENVKQDVIALSEEFNIITPYTSLLVLETDADRERFAVKRRFQMRDGEKFFAAGRDNAAFELRQKQMRLAAEYRTALRRRLLSELESLGRNAHAFHRPRPDLRAFAQYDVAGLGTRLDDTRAGQIMFGGAVNSYAGLGGHTDGTPTSATYIREAIKRESELFFHGDIVGRPIYDGQIVIGDGPTALVADLPKEEQMATDFASTIGPLNNGNLNFTFGNVPAKPPVPGLSTNAQFESWTLGLRLDMPAGTTIDRDGLVELKARARAAQPFYANPYSRYERRVRPTPLPWLGTLFPPLASIPHTPKEPKSLWPAPVVALSQSLLRADKLAQLKGGLVITRQSDTFDSRGELSGRRSGTELVSPGAWLARTAPDGGQVTVEWCDAKERGVYVTGFQLGSVRPSHPNDLKRPSLGLTDHSLSALHVVYARMVPAVENIAKDRALLLLKAPEYPDYETRVLIDTARWVVLSVESRHKNKVTGQTRFSDFIEAGGQWWARRVETLNADERRTALTTQTVTAVPDADFARALARELEGRAKVQFLRPPLPSITDAKKRVAEGKATFDDRAVLTLHFAATQQWDRAATHLQELEKLAPGKVGVRWLKDAFLLAARRHEELRQRLLAEAAALVAADDPDTRANDYALAEHLISTAMQMLQADERLALNDRLLKVYERQPAHLGAVKSWRNRRLGLLEETRQADQARVLAKEIATDYPRDHSAQYRYVQMLAGSGDYAAAYAWLDRVLTPEVKWDHPQYEYTLRQQYADLLRQQGRYRDLADYLGAWVERSPESESPYARYLSALVWSSRSERAEALTAQWVREAQKEGELPPAIAARLGAAVNFALGRGHELSTSRPDERWSAPLAEAATFFVRRDDQLSLTANILNSSRFGDSDTGRALRKQFAEELVKNIDALSLARVSFLLDSILPHTGTDGATWQAVAAALRKRWEAEKEPHRKHQIGKQVARALTALEGDGLLEFQRRQLETAAEGYRSRYAQQLFDALLGRDWTPAAEDELFSLLDKLSADDESAGVLFTKVAALHRLTDALTEHRFRALMKAVEKPEQLPRTELLKKQEEARKAARTGFADRLRKEAAKQPKPFADWITVERVWLDVQLDRDLKSAADDCWAIVARPVTKRTPDPTEGNNLAAMLDEVLHARAVVTLEHLAARKGADPALVERLVKYVDRQTADGPDAPRWRGEKYRLYMALDRSNELEAELVRWTAGPEADNRWRLALGYLLAERGKVADAIRQLEAVERADELPASAHRSLIEWYTAENRRADTDRARTTVYQTTDEYQLSALLNAHLVPWRNDRGPLPTTLAPEVLEIFKVLFAKSSAPQNYLSHLQQFYGASRDFRLLRALPDAVVGHTAERVYPFLQGMSGVLGEVRDEAVADELIARLAEVRKSAKTPVDQRALDLLELSVERRAADLHNQPGPHAEKALATLQRAFKREWAAGEPRLMADFLAHLGAVPQPALAAEQLRQLEALHRDAPKGSYDRFHIATRYASVLSAHARTSSATDVLSAALDEFAEANAGVLPTSANDTIVTLVWLHARAKHYDRAEGVLRALLKRPVHLEQQRWLTSQLFDLYQTALNNRGTVSLGEGAALYKALETKLIAELTEPDQNHRSGTFGRLMQLYRTAHDLKIDKAGDDLRTSAFTRLPKLLREQVTNHYSTLGNIAGTLRDVIGPREAIRFILDRADEEPEWTRYTDQDTWNQFRDQLAQWRDQAKPLGDLEPRLLKLVLAELRRDLRSRAARSRTGYDNRYSYFWTDKADEFARVAEEVLAEQKGSGAAAEYVAEYLFSGLPREARAIEVLLAAHGQKLLSESGRSQLADYLHRRERFAESVPVLLALVAEHPDQLAYRTRLMHAYFRTGRHAELHALLKATDAHFHEKDRWTESALAAVAYSCLENRLFEQAVTYYQELIPKRQGGAARRGTGDSELSRYYTEAARAYAGLGKTREAVDMASGAVVTWGPRHEQRERALAAVVEVLAGAPDLAGYLAWLDKEPLQSAVIRKAVGQAFIQKNDHARAVPHLRLAAELQPDSNTYDLLLTCLDKVGLQTETVQLLLDAVEVSRRDAKLYEQLGRRYAQLDRTAESERAYTSIVEALPNESEGHARLAEVRERQGRWADAVAHWERVAELRALEPTGLLKLGAAQVEAKEFAAATGTLKKLRSRTWPERFNEVDNQIRELQQKLDARSQK
ncbi:VIT domain-containing protein [Gemmata sp. JC717]|uniref:VIT domain-containing protein n=1 Tax=Gemmata algarum TaxID=2975278 RepID=UPI0021BBAA05|nr:VIT domain-containing protein [Gemmata algarum]MDY3551508.1 VIT domain-containing protein [Gemmata algarum]